MFRTLYLPFSLCPYITISPSFSPILLVFFNDITSHLHSLIPNNFRYNSYQTSWLSKNQITLMLFRDPSLHYECPPTFKSYSLYHSLRIISSYFTYILYISYLIISNGNDIILPKSSLHSNILTYLLQYL